MVDMEKVHKNVLYLRSTLDTWSGLFARPPICYQSGPHWLCYQSPAPRIYKQFFENLGIIIVFSIWHFKNEFFICLTKHTKTYAEAIVWLLECTLSFHKLPHLPWYRLWPSISPHCKLDSSNCLDSFPSEMNCAADTLVWVSPCVYGFAFNKHVQHEVLSFSSCPFLYHLSKSLFHSGHLTEKAKPIATVPENSREPHFPCYLLFPSLATFL